MASFLFCKLSCLLSAVASQTPAPVPFAGTPIFGSTLPLPLAAEGIGPVPSQTGVSVEADVSLTLLSKRKRSIKDGVFGVGCF